MEREFPIKVQYGSTPERVEEMIDEALETNPKVKFMREELEKAGCPVGRRFFRAKDCTKSDKAAAGGFMETEGIILCSNAIRFQNEADEIITHELIHAYDQCRAANMNWRNCAHQACSEIRAGNLSGDCQYRREILRGFFNICKQHQLCIRRRSIKSLSINPGCKSRDHIESTLDQVWDTCYKDTKPFDKAL